MRRRAVFLPARAPAVQMKPNSLRGQWPGACSGARSLRHSTVHVIARHDDSVTHVGWLWGLGFGAPGGSASLSSSLSSASPRVYARPALRPDLVVTRPAGARATAVAAAGAAAAPRSAVRSPDEAPSLTEMRGCALSLTAGCTPPPPPPPSAA
jgi:hypothetical protein